jgi:hypothetical protein
LKRASVLLFIGRPSHRRLRLTGFAVVTGALAHGDEQLVEAVGETGRRGDEVPGAGRDQPLVFSAVARASQIRSSAAA